MQIEKKLERDSDRRHIFLQNKRAEEMAKGMAVRNATLEQHGHKVKEEELITDSAKAAGDEAAAWAAKCADAKHQYPSRSLCCSVSIALQSPTSRAIKTASEQADDLEQMRTLISKERAEELARVQKAKIAASAGRAWAILQKHFKK